MGKIVLGLDLGSNSIGFSLLNIFDDGSKIVFEELVSNSIVFSEPYTAEERRNARSSRRRNERKSARKKFTRRVFVKYGIASSEFVENTTKYLNNLAVTEKDVYRLREKAVSGEQLSKGEFILAVYSILTDRGYNNMFSISNEDGEINAAVTKNKKAYLENNYVLPSKVLTLKREEQEGTFQNVSIRNKKGNYSNSLDRELHKEELIKVVNSQCDNQVLFNTSETCQKFLSELLDESKVNSPFYQRPLKSFENMVEYCTFYDKYNPKGQEKRVPLSNVRNIELTMRQKLENYKAVHSATDEVKQLTKDEIDKVINYWIDSPSSNEINAKNFLQVLDKKLKLNIPEKVSQVVLDIK
ncbi:MAG TPA: hypothetical protein ENO02_07255, partial [Epsilonproteobacteria bacterium]|nr:hypothetical protein [Campylobacterota bacterium]